MGRLEGRIALVTGAGAGIGEAIAERFVGEGAQVIVNDVHGAAAKRVAERLGGVALEADVSDSRAVAQMFEEVARRFRRLDVLVNNAGISGAEQNPDVAERFSRVAHAQMQEQMSTGEITTHWDVTVELSDEEWRRVLAVHLDGTFYCTREALKIMNRQPGASVINMASVMGTSGGPGVPAYCAAKGGILGFTRSLARELASRRIRVNAIAPGWIETAMTEPLAPVRPLLEAQTPLGHLGTPDDIAWAAVYLASDEAKFLTGQVISPNGGWTMNQ